MAFDGYIKTDENVVNRLKTSKAAILVDWLSLPTLFMLFFLTVIVPVAVKTYASNELKTLIMENAGLEELGLGDLLSDPFRTLFPEISGIVRGLLIAVVIILYVIWFAFCCIRTKLNTGYELVITDKRILASVKGEISTESWKDIKNVYIERSIWGRMLKFGTVTINAVSRTVTVRHIVEPMIVRNEFYSRCGENFY